MPGRAVAGDEHRQENAPVQGVRLQVPSNRIERHLRPEQGQI